MKVLLVDDNRLMLEGLQNLLEAHKIDVAGLAIDGKEALTQARKLNPEVILMDIKMPQCDGLTATRLIKTEMPEARIIILTTSTEDQDLFEAVKSGACGYLLKSMDTNELIEALIQAQEGVPPFSPGLADKLLKEFARLATLQSPVNPSVDSSDSTVSKSAGLTLRQLEVLELVSQGLSYKEVGTKLALSAHTVRYHMVEIMDKLHLANRAEVLAYAGRNGLTSRKPDE